MKDEKVFAEACHELITNRTCQAECCGPIPMSRELMDKYFELITSGFTDIVPSNEDAVFPVSEDLFCVFLDRDTRHCNIYSERPNVCRKCGDESHPQMCCPYLQADGTVRTRAERRTIVRNSSEGQKKLDDVLAQQREKHDWRW